MSHLIFVLIMKNKLKKLTTKKKNPAQCNWIPD